MTDSDNCEKDQTVPDRTPMTPQINALFVCSLLCVASLAEAMQDDPVPVEDPPIAKYTLTIDGPCPGTISIKWSGAPANQRQGLIVGNSLGQTSIPVGQPCSGVVLGLKGDLRLIEPPGFFSTGPGSGTLTGTLKDEMCGRYLQFLQGVACETSNVERIPITTPEPELIGESF
jgi:hypothetical protein